LLLLKITDTFLLEWGSFSTHTCSNWRGCQSKSPTCAQ